MRPGGDQLHRREADISALRRAIAYNQFQQEYVIDSCGFINDLQNFRAENITPERPARTSRPAGQRMEKTIERNGDVLLQLGFVHPCAGYDFGMHGEFQIAWPDDLDTRTDHSTARQVVGDEPKQFLTRRRS